jgi:hypothetical protein
LSFNLTTDENLKIDRAVKIESSGKIKMWPEFQKFSGKFKTTRASRNLWPKIQILGRTLRVPLEIRNGGGTIEKFRGKLILSLKI